MAFSFRSTPAKAGAIGAVAGVLALAAVFIQPWEGFEPRVAPDPIGVPTWCYGETEGPIPYGETFTIDDCKEMLINRLPKYYTGMMRCVKVPLPEPVQVAFLSFTYNVGVGAFCRSTLVKKLNRGDLRGACDELLRWNRAGGRVLRGLTRRRQDERALCLQGV